MAAAVASPTGMTPVPPPPRPAAAVDATAATPAGLPPLSSGPPQRPNLVTPTIQVTREKIENDFFDFYHTTVDTVNEATLENLSEEEGLRVATIRAQNAKEATTVTAAAVAAAGGRHRSKYYDARKKRRNNRNRNRN